MDEFDQKKGQGEERPLRVLIADDDTPTRMLLKAAIAQWGYQVQEAKDGEEAWHMVQQTDAPRLLIIDWLMPNLDGITLCARIRQELPCHPYIILLTQVTGTTNIIKGLEAGADEFLSKPFNMAELRSRLSIGARIIRDENKLDEKNKQLQHHLLQMESLLLPSLAITQQLIEMGQQEGTLRKESFLDKVQLLHQQLKTMAEMIANLDVSQQKRS